MRGSCQGAGYGATIQIEEHFYYEYGQWCYKVTENRSSNWREYINLVEAIERTVVEHNMRGPEFFIFTDNSTAEAAFWKGTSNWREYINLVEAIERTAFEHDMRGPEFFIFTDNSTAEAAFWKGTSKSSLLFELVLLRLKELEMELCLQIHVVHVSGKRMIAEGCDGLSRADHGEGVMLGKDI